MRKLTFISLILLLPIMFFACKDCEPVSQPGNQLIVEFYRLDSLLSSGERVVDSLRFEQVAGIENDSILYNSTSDSSSLFLLPLSSFENTSEFVFQTNASQSDTLSFQYSFQVISEGPDCGFYESFEEIILLQSTFDSAQVIKANIGLNDAVHVEVFR